MNKEFLRMQFLAGIVENTSISYTAIVLTKNSHNQLLPLVPKDWDKIGRAHV